eukprot:GILI01017819.1.p1 GENE.GILI01017819.1~~GILI01017819.1.p1  ORF type:complete len:342 (-),score=-15.54 GILI01017819.1:560-1585(-)
MVSPKLKSAIWLSLPTTLLIISYMSTSPEAEQAPQSVFDSRFLPRTTDPACLYFNFTQDVLVPADLGVGSPDSGNKFLEHFYQLTNPIVSRWKLEPARWGSSDRVAVLIESRCQPLIPWAVKFHMNHLGPTWSLLIVHIPENSACIRELLGVTKPQDRIVFLEMSSFEYPSHVNSLLLSPEFYQNLPQEHIFVFGLDSLLLQPNDLSEYLKYDYVGAPWKPSSSWCSAFNCDYGGNGGLSLRRRSAMLRLTSNLVCDHTSCSRKISREPDNTFNEDIWITTHMVERKDYLICPRPVCSSFSVETIFHPNPIGVHKPFWWLSAENIFTLYSQVCYLNSYFSS